MFDQYDCGCVMSRLQGRVRVCVSHRSHVDDGGNLVRTYPTGNVVKRFPANGEMPSEWTGK